MKDVYTQFIADYLDKSTRPAAQMNLLRAVEYHNDELEKNDIEVIVIKAMNFVAHYEKSWPWQRQRVIAESLRSFN